MQTGPIAYLFDPGRFLAGLDCRSPVAIQMIHCEMGGLRMSELRPWLNLIMQRRRPFVLGGLLLALDLFSAVRGCWALSGWFIHRDGRHRAAWAAGQRSHVRMSICPVAAFVSSPDAFTVARYFERVFNHNNGTESAGGSARGRLFFPAWRCSMAQPFPMAPPAAARSGSNRLTADIRLLWIYAYYDCSLPPLVALLGHSGCVCGLIRRISSCRCTVA